MEKITFAGIGIGIAGILKYIGIDDKIFYLFIILLALDLITGVMKGYVYKDLSSSTFISGLFKKSSLLFLIISISIGLKILGYDSKTYIDFIFGALTGAEIYSIIGNVYVINTGKKVSEFSAIEAILKLFLNITKNTIHETTKTLEYKGNKEKKSNGK